VEIPEHRIQRKVYSDGSLLIIRILISILYPSIRYWSMSQIATLIWHRYSIF